MGAAETRILVIALGGAGDVLMATPLLRALHERQPDAIIDVLVMQGAAARDVLSGNPCVNACILHNFMQQGPWRSLRLCWALRRSRYDFSLTVMPQNRFEYNLITWLIGARRRIGFDFAIACGAMSRLFLTHRIPEDTSAHLVNNNLRLLDAINEDSGEGQVTEVGTPDESEKVGAYQMELFLSESSTSFADTYIDAHELRGRILIGIHPGSGKTKNLVVRRWPPGKWAKLAKLLAGDPQIRMLVFGSREEDELRQAIIREAGLSEAQILDVPAGSLHNAAALISRLDCLICCDTLLTHVAAAVRVPEVVIMGPTPHTSVFPYGVPHRIVRTGIECSPCYGYSRHGITCTNAIKFACLKDIGPEMVFDSVSALLAETRA